MNYIHPENRHLSLAAHLRTVAALLASDAVFYDWKKAHACNCGLLAMSVTGATMDEMIGKLTAHGRCGEPDSKCVPTWKMRASTHCSVSGKSKDYIFRKLAEVGMQFQDYGELENLSNPKVLEHLNSKMGFSETKIVKHWFKADEKVVTTVPVRYNNSTCLRFYLISWASMIEEFHARTDSTEESKLEQVELRPLVPNSP